MAHPSPAAIAAIQTQTVAPLASHTDAEVAAVLNAPSVPNPAPEPPPVPAPLDQQAILAVLVADPTAIDRMNSYVHLDHVLANLAAGDRQSLALWFVLMTSGSTPIIAPAQAATIGGMLAATVPDPSWPPQISWAAANLSRPVDADDVAAARAN